MLLCGTVPILLAGLAFGDQPLKLTIDPVDQKSEEYGVFMFEPDQPFRFRVSLENWGKQDIDLLMPGKQNAFEKVFYFQLLNLHGRVIDTEDRATALLHGRAIPPDKTTIRSGTRRRFTAYLNSHEYGIEHEHNFNVSFAEVKPGYYHLQGIYDTTGYQRFFPEVPEFNLYSNKIKIEVMP